MLPCLLTDSVTFDIDRAVHYALLWGLEGVELRTVGGVHDRVPFVNEDKLKRRLAEGDLPVVAVSPGTFVGTAGDRAAWLNELSEFDATVNFCRRMACPRVIVSSFQSDGDLGAVSDALSRAAKKCADLRLCVLNERGYTAATGEQLAALLDRVDLENVRAAWDPVAAAMEGEDPDEGLLKIGDRVEIVRCHNGAREGNAWEARPIDNGDINWSAQLRQLARVGFDGPLSFEVDVEPAASEGLRGATALIRMIRSVTATQPKT